VKNNARTARVAVSSDGKGLVSQAGAVLLWVDHPGESGGPQTWKDEGPWRHSGNTRRSCGNAR
jgi:hypothetical protein